MLYKFNQNRFLVSLALCVLFFSTVSANAATVGVSQRLLSSGLIGYWTFDGKSMIPNARDASGQGVHGNLSGFIATTTVAGKVGQGLRFDGVDDKVQVSPAPAAFLVNNYSYAFWVKPISAANGQFLFEFGDNTFGDQGLDITGGKFRVVSYYTSNATADVLSGGTTVQANKWYHITVVRNIPSNKLSLYVNGVRDVSDIALGAAAAYYGNDPKTINIGSRNTASFFNGIIDEVRFYNRALSAGEVKLLYTLGSQAVTQAASVPNVSNGLVVHQTFDGKNLIRNAADTSGQGNHGNLSGFTSTTTVAGKIGQALRFDGADDSVIVSHNANQLLTGGGTFAAWIRPNGQGESTSGRILDKSSVLTGVDGFTWGLANNGGNTRIGMNINGGTGVNSEPVYFTLGKWAHVAVTFDSTGRVSNYINGVLVGAPAVSGDPVGITTTNALTIGNRSTATDRTFDGTIDDLRVYNRPLSSTEIKMLYNSTR